MSLLGGMFLLGLAPSEVIQPNRWAHIGGSSNSYEVYLDRKSISRSGEKVTVWTRRDFVLRERTIWNEFEIDCSARTETILTYVEDDSGNISHNVARPHRAAAPIQPKSVEERIFGIVCR